MNVFSNPEFDQHEQVVFAADRDTGLRAIIAIHNTNLGPALGGCRMWPYATEEEAITDVLRLSRGMTYKSAMAGLPLGGGKAVVIGDPRKHKTPALLQALGTAVERLGGRYITAEDVGTAPADMLEIRKRTGHVCGIGQGDAATGDPSPYTALGCFVGIQAAVKHRLGRPFLQGLTVAVQGLGHVGFHLCRLLHDAGAQLVVTDIDPQRCRRAESELGARVVGADAIFDAEAEVFAPCALGAVINRNTIARLKVHIVAGAANNQLADASCGQALRDKGILYAPDYVINAGGVIKVCREHFDGDRLVDDEVLRIHDTLLELFDRAEREGIATNLAADRIAEEKIYGPPAARRPALAA
jgi:leucine dehydrogenase